MKTPAKMKRTYKDGDRLTDDESRIIKKTSKCPDCNGELLKGPNGAGQNIKCEDCDAKFNLTPFGIDRISDNFKHNSGK